jgi:hypothetical protein
LHQEQLGKVVQGRECVGMLTAENAPTNEEDLLLKFAGAGEIALGFE